VDPHLPLVFQLFVVHASFHKKFRHALDPEQGARSLEVLSHIERDMNSCLMTLESISSNSTREWAHFVYEIACKISMDQRISELDKQKLWGKAERQPTGEMGEEVSLEDVDLDAEAKQLNQLLTLYNRLNFSV
jgi:hypothetical protein